ncbi:MAG: flagellar hook-length control protein FliK [Proteobacteria bacterium]|nr:flagellar hook-length control protein FliK [Pseudomonadota bacterium]
MTTLSRILLSSSELVLDLLQDKKGAPVFKENQLVEAKVTQVFSQGKAQLRIEGQLVEVKTHLPLVEDETLYLKVTKTGDSQVLKLVEAHKPVSFPPGLAEMRTMGQEGPYENLAKVLNQTAKGTAQIRSPSVPIIQDQKIEGQGTDQASPSRQRLSGQILSPGQGLGNNEKPPPAHGLPSSRGPSWEGEAFGSPSSGRLLATDRPFIEALIKQNAIPLELKLSLLITQGNPEKPSVPAPILESLARKLQSLMPHNESAAQKNDFTGNDPPFSRLGKQAQTLLKTFGPEDRTLLTKALENRSIGLGDKIRALFSSASETLIREKGLTQLRDILIKAFLPKGPGQTTAPGFLSPLPSMTDGSLFVNKNIFSELRELVWTMALKSDGPFDEKALKSLAKNSGLMWENKIKSFAESLGSSQDALSVKEQVSTLLSNDVKALSMKLAQSSEPEVQETVETLKRFVDSLEKMQSLNSHSADETGRYLLPLPFYSGENLRFGQLFFDLDRKSSPGKKEGDRIIRVAFLLDMSRLGHVQADFAIFKKSLGGEFIVGHALAKKSIDDALQEFQRALVQKGYSVTRMDCRIMDPETLASQSLTERMVSPPQEGAVNLRI